jgi:DNA-binding NarL/FixJ family response regulator
MKTYTAKKGKMLILIVDDNMCFVERMIDLLDDLANIGYINVATDYDEAFRIVTEEKPDLVLLDINLPGKNGIELLKKIRKSGNDCKVVMITNHADEYYRQQCSELGADHFLDKSNDFGKVPSIIKRLEAEWSSYSPETNS